jgi:hypothetical protein
MRISMAENKKITLTGMVTEKSDPPKIQEERKGYGTVEICYSSVPLEKISKIQKKAYLEQ